MTYVRRFDANKAGRDFVVGDIHGCFDDLRRLLAGVDFNIAVDRLFSVGDLVDRGPQSREAIEWLAHPWFHAIRGNHEQMAIDHVAGYSLPSHYLHNGGGWFMALPKPEQEATADAFSALPLVIELETDDGLIGIVHADPVFSEWAALTANIGIDAVQNQALWSRDRVQKQAATDVNGVSAVICGHTILDRVMSLGNVIYIDTGAVAGGALTMLRIGAKAELHSVSTKWQIEGRAAA